MQLSIFGQYPHEPIKKSIEKKRREYAAKKNQNRGVKGIFASIEGDRRGPGKVVSGIEIAF